MFLKKIFNSRKRTEIIYQIIIDRFSDENDFYGIVSNNEKIPPVYKGGNIRGIIKHLDYIKELGANSLLLSPLFKSAAYHGYHCITDKNEVDNHFGTVEDIISLINEAKKRNLQCGADFVPNHCHYSNPIVAEHKDWFRFPSDFNNYRYYAGLKELPVFNLDHKDAREYMINQALQLCAWGFDFLRIDHATGPGYSFLHELREQIKQEYPKVRLIGEVVGEMDFYPLVPTRYKRNIKERLSMQECRQMEYIGILDGLLDYEFYGIIKQHLNEFSDSGHIVPKLLNKSVSEHFSNYPSDFELWLFFDNHDVDRILHLCRGDVAKLKELLKFAYSLNRPVVILYGTEQGMKNGIPLNPTIPYSDESVRKCMDWKCIDDNILKKLYPIKCR